MSLGQSFATRRTVLYDPRTGREIWKISGWDDAHCAATYFYFQAFTPDDRHLVFGSNRSGRFELYRTEVDTGHAVQITDHAGAPAVAPEADRLWLCNVHPAGREVFYPDNGSIRATDIFSLKTRTVADAAGRPWRSITSVPALTRDGKQLVCTFVHTNGQHGITLAESDGSGVQEIYRMPPHIAEAISHVLPSTAPDLVASFVPLPDRQNDANATRAQRARAWGLDRHGRAQPLLVMPAGFRCTHEYWGPDGRLYFHKKTQPGWVPASVASINAQGGDFQEHFRRDRKLGHSFIRHDARQLVCDVQDPAGNELYLVDRDTGRAEVLCWPDSTVAADNNQLSHVHPFFSPTGRKIGFTSDKSGKAAVFVIPL